jgi:hypothetical protein
MIEAIVRIVLEANRESAGFHRGRIQVSAICNFVGEELYRLLPCREETTGLAAADLAILEDDVVSSMVLEPG